AGHVQHLEFRSLLANEPGNLTSAGPWHDHVGQKEVDGAMIGGGDSLRLLSALGAEHGKAGLLQDGLDELAQLPVVIYQQDRLAAAPANRARERGRGLLHSFCHSRQIDPEHGAGARRAIHRDVTSTLAYDAVHGRETKAGSLARWLRSKKGLENSG